MRPKLALHFMGRFGNQMFQYAFARAFAEKHGYDLETQPWVGQELFQINDNPVSGDYDRKNEYDIEPGTGNISYLSYSQQQKCVLYTKNQLKNWFSVRPEVERFVASMPQIQTDMVAHRRVGDYMACGYPVISESSYRNAIREYNFDDDDAEFVTEESPYIVPGFPDHLNWFPDFYRIMIANVIFRGNSCFSWWAATLSEGQIYSPVIDGLVGGVEHDNVRFVPGNHPRIADLHFVTDLHVA